MPKGAEKGGIVAYDSGLADLMRDDLVDTPDVSEKRMFGGLAFMLRGNMLCGVHKGGAMMRVGPAGMAAALAMPGVRPMDFTGRPMTGFVDVEDAVMADDTARGALMALALAHVGAMAPK